MARYFLSVVEFIKQRNFDVHAPAFYQPHMPAELLNAKPEPYVRVNPWRMVATNRLNTAPFRQVEDPHQLQRCSYSIEIMLDMFRKKIEFQIVNDEDIVEIFDGLDRYLLSIRPDVELGDERSIEYARLVISWREEVYKHYYRYMQMNPAAKEKLYPNNDPTKNFLHLMSITNGIKKEQLDLDPLRAKAAPPYQVDAIKPSDHKDDNGFDIEGSFGLASSKVFKDDGRDFDIDDFLKRG